jgi:hypothetical protein
MGREMVDFRISSAAINGKEFEFYYLFFGT